MNPLHSVASFELSPCKRIHGIYYSLTLQSPMHPFCNGFNNMPAILVVIFFMQFAEIVVGTFSSFCNFQGILSLLLMRFLGAFSQNSLSILIILILIIPAILVVIFMQFAEIVIEFLVVSATLGHSFTFADEIFGCLLPEFFEHFRFFCFVFDSVHR